MDDDEWAEYRMSEEARYELTYEPDYDPYDYYDDMDADYYAARAEEEAEYYWNLGYEAYFEGERLVGDEPYEFEDGFKTAMEEDNDSKA